MWSRQSPGDSAIRPPRSCPITSALTPTPVGHDRDAGRHVLERLVRALAPRPRVVRQRHQADVDLAQELALAFLAPRLRAHLDTLDGRCRSAHDEQLELLAVALASERCEAALGAAQATVPSRASRSSRARFARAARAVSAPARGARRATGPRQPARRTAPATRRAARCRRSPFRPAPRASGPCAGFPSAPPADAHPPPGSRRARSHRPRRARAGRRPPSRGVRGAGLATGPPAAARAPHRGCAWRSARAVGAAGPATRLASAAPASRCGTCGPAARRAAVCAASARHGAASSAAGIFVRTRKDGACGPRAREGPYGDLAHRRARDGAVKAVVARYPHLVERERLARYLATTLAGFGVRRKCERRLRRGLVAALRRACGRAPRRLALREARPRRRSPPSRRPEGPRRGTRRSWWERTRSSRSTVARTRARIRPRSGKRPTCSGATRATR